MTKWIKIEKQKSWDGFRTLMSAAPEVELEDAVIEYETEEEADEAMERTLLYAENLQKQGRVTAILVRGENLPAKLKERLDAEAEELWRTARQAYDRADQWASDTTGRTYSEMFPPEVQDEA